MYVEIRPNGKLEDFQHKFCLTSRVTASWAECYAFHITKKHEEV